MSGTYKDETDKQDKSFHHTKNKLQIFMASLKWNFSNTLFVSIFFSFISMSLPYCVASEVNFEGHQRPCQQKLILLPKINLITYPSFSLLEILLEIGECSGNHLVFKLQHLHAWENVATKTLASLQTNSCHFNSKWWGWQWKRWKTERDLVLEWSQVNYSASLPQHMKTLQPLPARKSCF